MPASSFTFFLSDDTSADTAVFDWERLTSFQRLLLIRILRPDVLTATSRLFVEKHLGPSYLSSGSFDLKEIYEESTAKTPLVFILSPGTWNILFTPLSK